MSSETLSVEPAAKPAATTRRVRSKRPVSAHSTLLAHGEPMVWLTGGALAVALAMIILLLAKVVWSRVSAHSGRPRWCRLAWSMANNIWAR